MVISRDEFAQFITPDEKQFIFDCIRGGIADYADSRNYSDAARIDHPPGLRATLRTTHVVARARRGLVGMRSIRVSTKGRRVLFIVRDKIRISFKNLNSRLLSRNYPTPQALAFVNQAPMPWLDTVPEATNLVAGYRAVDAETRFELYITCPSGAQNRWVYELTETTERIIPFPATRERPAETGSVQKAKRRFTPRPQENKDQADDNAVGPGS